MSQAIRTSFRAQAKACAALGSPFTARVLRLLANHLRAGTPVADRVLTWPGDPGGRGDALALRLAGGLHALVRRGQETGLAAFYAAPASATDAMAASALLTALQIHGDFLMRWLDSPPQTNELRRSAVLIATAHWLRAHLDLPLVLSELGTSAGLNLIWDRYALQIGGQTFGPADPVLTLTPDWHGTPPPATQPQIKARAGVDLNPLDPIQDRERLLSYIWADQPDRLRRTALALDEADRLRPAIARADAVDWLKTRLATQHLGALHLVFHTVAWQYFPAATQAQGEAMLAMAGARATPAAPLARLAMEADTNTPGAALTLQLWPGNHRVNLGRADFHCRWIDWQAPPP